nr:MarR family transcriptional regulator [Actinomycetota bacterium]
MGLNAAYWAASLPLETMPTASARAVLAMFGVRAHDPGYGARLSVKLMAEELGVTPRTVQRAIRDLLAADLIRPGNPAEVQHLRADRRPNVYDLLTPDLLNKEAGGL